jgi:hypothetical protein
LDRISRQDWCVRLGISFSLGGLVTLQRRRSEAKELSVFRQSREFSHSLTSASNIRQCSRDVIPASDSIVATTCQTSRFFAHLSGLDCLGSGEHKETTPRATLVIELQLDIKGRIRHSQQGKHVPSPGYSTSSSHLSFLHIFKEDEKSSIGVRLGAWATTAWIHHFFFFIGLLFTRGSRSTFVHVV